MEIITGVERRRRWSVEEKLRIVAETEQLGVTVHIRPGNATLEFGGTTTRTSFLRRPIIGRHSTKRPDKILDRCSRGNPRRSFSPSSRVDKPRHCRQAEDNGASNSFHPDNG